MSVGKSTGVGVGELWCATTRNVVVGERRIPIIASGDCPGRILDGYVGPLVHAVGSLSGRFIDVCGWDGALSVGLLAGSSMALGICNSHSTGSARSAQANLKSFGCEVRWAYGIEPSQIGQFDTALIRVPYWLGNKAVRLLVISAWKALREGGMVYLAGERSRGFKTFAAMLGDVFGEFETVSSSGGVRVIRGRRGRGRLVYTSQAAGELAVSTVLIRGLALRIACHPAIFASGMVDSATQMLIDCLPRSTGMQLDLGCGSGVVAAAMAYRSPDCEVTAADSNLVAVDVALRTVALNELHNVVVRPSYFGEGLAGARFDVIACYPPFHIGPRVSHRVAHQLIREAAGLLKPDGEFLVVQGSAQSYERLLHACFGRVSKIAQSKSYKTYGCSIPLNKKRWPLT